MMADMNQTSQSWLLSELLAESISEECALSLIILGLTLNSKEVQPEELFIACNGNNAHGIDFIDQVIAQGAVAILAELSNEWSFESLALLSKEKKIPIVAVEYLSEKVSHIAGVFYSNKNAAIKKCGVTGTNGKTSVAHYLAQLLETKFPCAVMGTLGNGLLGNLETSTHTTLDAVKVQKKIAEFNEQKISSVVMEVSSHALTQHRVADVKFDTAVFTNLSRDHLDYHKTMESYAQAKSRLFKFADLKHAIVNLDDPYGEEIVNSLSSTIEVITYSLSNKKLENTAFINAIEIKSIGKGTWVNLETSWGNANFVTSLLGLFNIENLLAVAGVALKWGMDFKEVIKRLASVKSVSGRMESMAGEKQSMLVVDFAHTPDALEKALLTLRPYAKGSLKVVFGCGGDRDKGKRAEMGSIASALADEVILTDDNPRTEKSADIILDIQSGIESKKNVLVMADRKEAVRYVVKNSHVRDVVLVAGKGHETYQQVGGLKHPFSDQQVVRDALKEFQS